MKIYNKSGFGFDFIHSFGTKVTLPKSPEFRQVREFEASAMFFFHSVCGSGKVEKVYWKWKEGFQKAMGPERAVRVQVCFVAPGGRVLDIDPDINFPTLNPAYMGLKSKHSFPAYSMASWLQNPLSSTETDTTKDKHLDYLLPTKRYRLEGKLLTSKVTGLPPLCKQPQGQRQAGGKALTSKAICSPSPT